MQTEVPHEEKEPERIFLGRHGQLEDFGRILARFLEFNPAPKLPQVVLISGQGGIGKSTLLRHLLAMAEGSYADRYQLLHIDWQEQKQLNPTLAVEPHQLEARNMLNVFDGLAQHHLVGCTDAYSKARQKIEKAKRAAWNLTTRMKELAESPNSGAFAEEGAKALAKTVTLSMEAAGLGTVGKIAEPLVTALGKLGLNLAPTMGDKLAQELKKEDLDLLVQMDIHLTRGLSDSLAKAADKKPVLVALDTYEIVDELDTFVRLLIQACGPHILWLIAGRRDLYETRLHTPKGRVNGYREEDRHAHEAHRIDLAGLAREDIRTFFRHAAPGRRALEDEEVRLLDEVTGAIPLAIELAAKIWSETGDLSTIISEEQETAEEIVSNMVGRYQQHCVREEDHQALAALAMADGDPEILEAMLLPEFEDGATYRRHLTRVRHRYAAVQHTSSREPRLHDEPARFFLEFYQERMHRRLRWVQEFHCRAVEHVKGRINGLVAYHIRLQDLCEDEDYLNAVFRMTHHLFWLDQARAWPFLMARFVEGLAYSSALNDGLLEVVARWAKHLDAKGSKRFRTLKAGRDRWQGPENAALGALLADDTQRGWLRDRDIENRHDSEREAIVLWNLAEIRLREERREEALELLRQAAALKGEIGTRVAETALQVSYQFFGTKDLEQTRTACQLATVADPSSARAWEQLGTSYSFLTSYEKAIECHRKALEIYPEYAKALKALGTNYSLLKNYKKAFEFRRKALDIDPQNASAWSGLGKDLALTGQSQSSVEAFEKSIELDGQNDRALASWGDLLYRQNLHLEAAEKFRDALEAAKEPGRSAKALLALIAMMRILNQSEDQASLLEQVEATMEADYYVDHDALEAQRLALEGKSDLALEALEKVIKLVPAVSAHARFYPTFHTLRDDPRFIKMTEDVPGSSWNDF